jgi:hypothetical protein
MSQKTVGNYNEFRSNQTPVHLPPGVIELEPGDQPFEEWQSVVAAGCGLVKQKINELLGERNMLIAPWLALPKITIVPDRPEMPNVAGYFDPQPNEITLVSNKISNEQTARKKVVIHELIHFFSHNGRDDAELLTEKTPIAQNNNIGLARAGLDIREGKEGEVTTDYFLAFNEAVTEQLSIDIQPGGGEVYSDYRELLGQVIEDGVAIKLGAKNSQGRFEIWSSENIKQYIYLCFFRGDLVGFTSLLKNIYSKFDLSEQQFGLMTNKDDLPSVIEHRIQEADPHTPPPSPSKVAALVQVRLNNKTPDDYITDIIDPKPDDDGGDKYGIEYDSFIGENGIIVGPDKIIEGVSYEADNGGMIIYRGVDAASRLAHARAVLDSLLPQLKTAEIDVTYVNEQVDNILFDAYRMSMLTDGFRDFYVYKHTEIGA